MIELFKKELAELVKAVEERFPNGTAYGKYGDDYEYYKLFSVTIGNRGDVDYVRYPFYKMLPFKTDKGIRFKGFCVDEPLPDDFIEIVLNSIENKRGYIWRE